MTDREQLKEELQALADRYQDSIPYAGSILYGLAGMIIEETEQEVAHAIWEIVQRRINQIKASRN